MIGIFANNVFERYSVKRIALRQSPCGIPRVVKVCPFVILFFNNNNNNNNGYFYVLFLHGAHSPFIKNI